VRVEFRVSEWQFLMDEQEYATLVIALEEIECRCKDVPLDAVEVCPRPVEAFSEVVVVLMDCWCISKSS